MKSVAWGLALSGLVLVPAVVAAREVAQVVMGSSQVQWDVQVEHDSVVMVVSKPDTSVVRGEFPAGKAPVYAITSSDPDGVYQWELRAVPKVSDVVSRELATARKSGDPTVLWRLRKEGKLAEDMVASGSFTVERGAIVPQSESEPVKKPKAGAEKKDGMNVIFAADQVIPDDLIVQQSLCVGFDCVDGESFGFDTIRLKENNTRIKFEDTSAGTFPSNDWQLTANDSASGGSNKFSIEDVTGAKVPFTITAGASTNSIFVDSTGRVGFRTATPVLDLHVATSNTPSMRLEQNNSGGFTAQTWDIAGNEANFFIRDVTSGSRLPFRIRPGAPTSSIDINASGLVGIGTASPSSKLTVKSAGVNDDVFEIVQSADATTIFRIFETSSGDGLFSVFDNTGAEAVRFTSVSGGRLAVGCNAPDHDLDIGNIAGQACSSSTSRSFINAGSTTFTASSSRTIKENLEPVQVPNILDKISGVDVYKYDFIEGPKDRIGLMAEDFHTVFGRGSDKLIDGQEVEMALWLAVKELTARNKELAQRLEDLESRLAAERVENP